MSTSRKLPADPPSTKDLIFVEGATSDVSLERRKGEVNTVTTDGFDRTFATVDELDRHIEALLHARDRWLKQKMPHTSTAQGAATFVLREIAYTAPEMLNERIAGAVARVVDTNVLRSDRLADAVEAFLARVDEKCSNGACGSQVRGQHIVFCPIGEMIKELLRYQQANGSEPLAMHLASNERKLRDRFRKRAKMKATAKSRVQKAITRRARNKAITKPSKRKAPR